MWALQFFVYALIIWLLALCFGGTMIGYYFTKRMEYEANKAKNLSETLKGVSEELKRTAAEKLKNLSTKETDSE